MLSMVVVATGKQVRARQPHKRQLRTVGAAANRLQLRFDIAVAHRLLGDIENMRMRHHLLAHVVIAVFNDQLNIAIRV